FATAGNFRRAKTAVRPDLYILDIMLPDGNGIDLCRELKAEQSTQQTPIIMMSAHFDKAEGQCDDQDFIAKTFDIDHFLSRITQQINLSPALPSGISFRSYLGGPVITLPVTSYLQPWQGQSQL